MAYCVDTDVKKRAELLSSVSSPDLANGIAWADGLIDARLGGRYSVPFNPVPVIIKELSADLAAYYCVFELHVAGGEGAPVEGALELKNRAMPSIGPGTDGREWSAPRNSWFALDLRGGFASGVHLPPLSPRESRPLTGTE